MTDNKSPDLNLDLIQMVQNARMMHDATARPSDYSAVYWIEAKRKQGDYPAPKPDMGEWRVELHSDTIDEVWERVKTATEQGELGYKSKVSTRPVIGQTEPEQRLLVVRTYSASDTADVERIKEVLIEMGLRQLSYQSDKAS